jgi:hypothetical protein
MVCSPAVTTGYSCSSTTASASFIGPTILLCPLSIHRAARTRELVRCKYRYQQDSLRSTTYWVIEVIVILELRGWATPQIRLREFLWRQGAGRGGVSITHKTVQIEIILDADYGEHYSSHFNGEKLTPAPVSGEGSCSSSSPTWGSDTPTSRFQLAS